MRERRTNTTTTTNGQLNWNSMLCVVIRNVVEDNRERKRERNLLGEARVRSGWNIDDDVEIKGRKGLLIMTLLNSILERSLLFVFLI